MAGTHAPAPGALTATGAGILRLELRTPFAVGTVNAYLLEDEPQLMQRHGIEPRAAIDEPIARFEALR